MTLLLIDKSYYDYDYEAVKKKSERKNKSASEMQSMMSRMGFATKLRTFDKPQGAEALQAFAMQEEELKQKK